MDQVIPTTPHHHAPWNKGKLVGQKAPLKLKEIWAIRIRLQLAERIRELAMFNLAVDSKLRSCDLARLRVRDVTHGQRMASRAIVMQQETQRPVFIIAAISASESRALDGIHKTGKLLLGASLIRLTGCIRSLSVSRRIKIVPHRKKGARCLGHSLLEDH
jgi:hypothetical protein